LIPCIHHLIIGQNRFAVKHSHHDVAASELPRTLLRGSFP